jgi:hypothetical protein
LFLKNRENLFILLSFSFRFIDLNNKYCIRIRIIPTENSIAEKIKKKNVKDTRFKLSKIKPKNNTILYKDIHKSSAVNNIDKEELILIIKEKSSNIKEKKRMLKSPISNK